ncbi:hypothetical protein DSC45_16280 [Streptomyces sp. YIM 130001]|uniref:DUF3152 domain-containing protein n=1 Tax=Streptomyces sp. YIM 130001 TaxID=2259644 RepID=UPI000E64BA95|nr:DUF3152 domain-containing protein [Streptomyces sp. YIM 130001]RII16145.1 hypothetical protein DSC45_16280 [Streptomyces sp. YIM 130001]
MGRHARRGDPRPDDTGTGRIPVVPPAGRDGAQTGRSRGTEALRGAVHVPGQRPLPRAAHQAPPAPPSADGVRGGHPEQREPGGGWGSLGGRPGPYAGHQAPGGGVPRPGGPRPPGHGAPGGPPSGPRRDYVAAFDDLYDDPYGDDDVFAAGAPRARDPYGAVTEWDPDLDDRTALAEEPPQAPEPPARSSRGRTFTGIAAAAVTTVLAVVVAGQVAADRQDESKPQAADKDDLREDRDSASRSEERPPPVEPDRPTYDDLMGKKYALAADLKGSGKFAAAGAFVKAPGKGQKFRYRVDVEKGMGLDAGLFADAVQKTLNDKRSWAHNGERTFERITSGKPDFVITLASPGTTATWCAKSGLDTTEDNVSCDSAATDRVMINAYRWAQGAKTYGDEIHPYRQMLINHEVGHRLGFNHVNCSQDGALAPVMQQQTKFLSKGDIKCKRNAWAYPHS